MTRPLFDVSTVAAPGPPGVSRVRSLVVSRLSRSRPSAPVSFSLPAGLRSTSPARRVAASYSASTLV